MLPERLKGCNVFVRLWRALHGLLLPCYRMVKHILTRYISWYTGSSQPATGQASARPPPLFLTKKWLKSRHLLRGDLIYHVRFTAVLPPIASSRHRPSARPPPLSTPPLAPTAPAQKLLK